MVADEFSMTSKAIRVIRGSNHRSELGFNSSKKSAFSAVFPGFPRFFAPFDPATLGVRLFHRDEFRSETASCRFLSDFVRGKVFCSASLVNLSNTGAWPCASRIQARSASERECIGTSVIRHFQSGLPFLVM